jgi:Uma2 family endonuclease
MAMIAARRTRPTNAVLEPAPPGIQLTLPISAMTLAGFRKWLLSDDCPEEGSFGFLDTEVFVDMSPERFGSHNAVKSALTATLLPLVLAADLGRYFSDGMPLSHEAANLSTAPDGMICSWATLESGRAKMIPSAVGDDSVEFEGAPDLVIEIVSPYSGRKDLKRLPALYHRAGISEFWLIDARGDRVAFRILSRRARSYVAAARLGGWQRSAVLGHRFRLRRQRDRLGLWEYRLDALPD